MENDAVRSLAEAYGLSVIYLFGSQAETGSRYLEDKSVLPDASSDLDVAIAFEAPPVDAIDAYGILFKEISEIFDPFSIDLIFMHEVNPLLQYEIIKGLRIFAKDEFSADEFEERIMKMAEDLSFKKKSFDKDIMEAVKNGYFEFEYSPNP
jgi:predicted nucleotidyltransferase